MRLIAKVGIEGAFVFNITDDLVDQSESKVAIYNWQTELTVFLSDSIRYGWKVNECHHSFSLLLVAKYLHKSQC